MVNVDLQTRQIFGPLIFGIAVFMIYSDADISLLVTLMVAAGTVVHAFNFAIRDATFRALMARSGVGPKDLFARCCTVVFDAVVLFGMVTGAGLSLRMTVFWNMTLGLALILPPVVIYMARRSRAAQSSQSGWPLDYWAPPVVLTLTLVMIYAANHVVFEAGSQPFVYLVLLSTIFALNRTGSRLVGRTKALSYVLLAVTAGLLTLNYLGLS